MTITNKLEEIDKKNLLSANEKRVVSGKSFFGIMIQKF